MERLKEDTQGSAADETAAGAAGSSSDAAGAVVTSDQILVTDTALASIVGLAAHEVPGVVGMAPVNLGEGLRRVLGLSQVDEGVVIEHPHGDGRADVALHVIVAYGVNISVVADSVRQRVRYVAKHLAGIDVEDVRVHVDGVSRG